MRFRFPCQRLSLRLFLVFGLCAGALLGSQNLLALGRLNTIPEEAGASFQLIAEAWKTVHKERICGPEGRAIRNAGPWGDQGHGGCTWG